MSHPKQRIAVIGAGIAGLSSAYFLQRHHEVTLFEAAHYLGGHSHTVEVNLEQQTFAVDTAFMVFNDKTYPNLIRFFQELNVASYETDMSFSVSRNHGALEWAGSNLGTVFAQKRNLFSPSFWGMIQDIMRFNKMARIYLMQCNERPLTLGELLKNERYGSAFQYDYLLPMAAAIWSTDPAAIFEFPASIFLQFSLNHGLLQINNRPQWKTIQGGSRAYVGRIAQTLNDVRLNTKVLAVSRQADGVWIETAAGRERFDQVIFATHAPDTLALLKDANEAETDILSKLRYQTNRVLLHTDPALLPRRKKIWSSWNYLSNIGFESQHRVCVSYLLCQLQRIPVTRPLIITLNPFIEPKSDHLISEFHYDHPIFDQAAITAQRSLSSIQGQRNSWFVGAWSGYGFHEDGFKSSLRILRQMGLAPEGYPIDDPV